MNSRASSSVAVPAFWSSLLLFFCLSHPGMAQVNVQGQWMTLAYTMPINPIHAALLNNGKVLIVAGSGNCPPSQSGCPSGAPYGPGNASGAALWDPVAGTITQFTLNWDSFCNGMVVLPDGRVFINGGTIQYDPFEGELRSSIFDPSNNTFTDAQSMAHGRWYPTVTTLGDGRVMTFSGLTETGATNTSVEIYTAGSGWSQQFPSGWTPPLYPRMSLLPDGKVFYSGSGTSSALFDPSTATWTMNVATTNYSGTRTYGTSVLLPLLPANNYDPKVMIFGGNSPATNTTEIIDLGLASPKWVTGPSMSQARIEMNAVILPNGKVLAVGGSVNDEDTQSLSLNADLFDLSTVNLTVMPPLVGTVSSAGANASQRLYHSVALLLPDATVWLAGGNPSRGTYNNTMEIYKPAYLFNSSGGAATRPTISTIPSSVPYGNAFTLQTPDAASISSVVLVRNGAVTHAFGMDQRLVGMNFTIGSGALTVTAPPNGNVAPPGYYMVFILNSSGVPSVAKMIQLVQQTAPPTVMSVSPNSGSVAGGTAVTLTGTNFAPGATVTFGTAAATNVVVNGSTTITATTPANAAGAVPVTVTVNGQSGSLANGFTYTGTVAVSFVQIAAATPQSTTATVTVAYPGAQTAGDLNVVVVGWNDTTATVQSVKDSAGNNYSVAIPVTSGTALRQTIYYAPNIVGGANTVTVTFSQAAAFPDVRVLEYRGVNTVDVTVGASGNSASPSSGSATTTNANELIFGANTVFTTNAAAGSGFTSRIITAPDSDIAEDKVVSTAGSNSATATLGSAGPWVMQMVAFTAVTGPAPTVTNVSPNSGTTGGGTPVTITGANFAAAATVTFGGTAASNVVVMNSSTITATTPAHAAGGVAVAVTVAGQSGSQTNGYTYITPPTVTGVNPGSGTVAGGTAVTITGTNFAAGATVTFGVSSATNVVVSNSTTITAVTPAGSAGAVSVTVTNSNGLSGSLAGGYAYVAPPTVTGVSPGSGTTLGGTAVTISGMNFAAGATVTFGGSSATNVVVSNSTTITATTPAGSAGAVTVTVTNAGLPGASLANGFTYVLVATVTSVSPNNGPPAGGTAVTIRGTNFASGATVSFGGTAATNVVVSNSTTITATTPAHTAGAVTVTVTVNGQSGSLANGFTYTGTVAVSFVQVAAATPQSTTATVTVAYPGAQTAGDLNVVVVGWNDTTATVQSVKDSAGNNYSVAIPVTSGTALQQTIYYAPNIVGGANTVTVTFSQAAAFPDVRVLEYRGVSTVDVTVGASGNSASPSSGSATTTNANELIFGANTVFTTNAAAGSGFTSRIITAPDSDIAEDKVVSTAGSNSATATLSSAGPWVMQMVTFK